MILAGFAPVSAALKTVDYLIAFGGALVLTLVLTPIVREMNRAMGMVDKPDPRRINKVPIPRGGGLALFIGFGVSYTLFLILSGRPPIASAKSLASGVSRWNLHLKLFAIASGVVALGYADDKFGLPPKIKLLGQLLAAFLVWSWTDLGFSRLWPAIPGWLDCPLTMFWIAGAINAFNLIDGLDGLASGIAFIATLGMAGTLLIIDSPQTTLAYFAFAGGLLGFLRYNYNPASVFLGDSGSMFIGFMLSVLPLVSQVPNSVLVSVGVPLLAMGVPIFDTSLAIVRRSIRHMIRKRDASATENGEVMTADADHLHHRILRAVGLSQRKAAWTLYLVTAAAVACGLFAAASKSRTAGLWLLAVAGASVVIFKNMARIEFYDAGRLLNAVARNHTVAARRLRARLRVPIMLAADIALMIFIYLLLCWAWRVDAPGNAVRLGMLIRVSVLFAFLVLFRAYRTVWSRAVLSNYMRIAGACFLGSLVGGAIAFAASATGPYASVRFSATFGIASLLAIAGVRLFRPLVRDVFYALDCSRLKGRKDVSRVLVYGAGLRYRTFRRELVRTTSANTRIIVGLLDDDILMRGEYIGGIRIEGTLAEAPEIINRLNADAVVVACEVKPEWLKIVRKTLEPTGVKVTLFTFGETEVTAKEESWPTEKTK
ncbi:MAG: hypothetical protein K6F50_06765 [Kiritimatiellae bacterium]|nr:hypothetical protein [Kiritimatiellia bacterium]